MLESLHVTLPPIVVNGGHYDRIWSCVSVTDDDDVRL